MESKIAIERLTGSNYEAWKFNAEMLLAREQLWKYVEEAPPNPITPAWKEGDHRTRGTIALLVGPGQRRLIQKCKSAKETWKKLEDTFEKSTPTTVLSMLRRVMTLKFSEGEDVGQHLNDLEDLFERLANAGYELPEKIQILIVLWSMPDTYDNLGQALVNVADKDLTLELIKVKLTDEALKRQETNISGESVLRVKSGKKQVVCHYCRKPGHLKRDCRLLVEEEESSDEVLYKPNERATDYAKPFALSVDLHKKTARKWLVDSGASAHMCGEKKFFDGMRPITKRTVTLADGRQTQAEAIGSGMLICKDKDGHNRKIVLSGVLYVPELKTNLVSVSRLTQKGAVVSFSGAKCYISQRGRQAAVAINRDGLYYLQQPTRELAGTVRCADVQDNQPEMISLDFDFPPIGTTSCMQPGGELSCVEIEKALTCTLQTKEEKFLSVGRYDDLQPESANQDDGGWIKVTGKRRAQGKRLVDKRQPEIYRRGGVLE